MQKRTHLAGGIFAAFILLIFIETQITSTPQKIIYIAIAAFMSLIPDIDHAKSTLGRKVKIISYFTKHRGFFHSLVFGIILTIIGFKLVPTYKFAIIGGYLSHLILDAFTHQGEQFLWPTKVKLKGLIKTGGIIEILVFMVLIVSDAYLFLLI